MPIEPKTSASPKDEEASSGTSPNEAAEKLDSRGQKERNDHQHSPSQTLFSRFVSFPSSQHKLRRPVSFYLGVGQFDHEAVANSIRENGGIVSPLPALSRKSKIINLVDADSKVPPNATAPAYKWTLIPDCIRHNTLLDFRPYQIYPTQPAGYRKSCTPVCATVKHNRSSPTAQPITPTQTAVAPINLHDGKKSSYCVIDPKCAHAGLPVKDLELPVDTSTAKAERKDSLVPEGAKDLSQNVLLTSSPRPETDIAGQGLASDDIAKRRQSVDHIEPSPGKVALSKSHGVPRHGGKRYLTRSYYQNKGIGQPSENSPDKSHEREEFKSGKAKDEKPCDGDSGTRSKLGAGGVTREKPRNDEKTHLIENDQLELIGGDDTGKKQTEHEETIATSDGGNVETGDQTTNTNVEIRKLAKIRRTGLLDNCPASDCMELRESPVDLSITNSDGARVRNYHLVHTDRSRGISRHRKSSSPALTRMQSKGKGSDLFTKKRRFNDNGAMNNNIDGGASNPEGSDGIEGNFKDRGDHNGTDEVIRDNNEDDGIEIETGEHPEKNHEKLSKRCRLDHLSQRTRKLRSIDAVTRLVPQIPPERALAVVDAVRMVSKRANVSQNMAFRMLLRYEGKIEQATNAAKALFMRSVNNPGK